MIAIVCPGQGSQTPGFLSGWLEAKGAREQLAVYSEAAGVDLHHFGTVADADAIRDTQIAQPLIVAASLLSWRALGSPTPDIVAGHSVGELAALAIAGVITDVEAMSLVGVRGRAMARAAGLAETGMAAAIGGEREDVVTSAAKHNVVPANENGGGQIVVAGPVAGIAAFAAEPPKGVRVIPLQVAGAFHTQFMADAVADVQNAVDELTPIALDPTTQLLTNSDGSVVAEGARALELIVSQITSPVRWDLCTDTLIAQGVAALIELAPGGTLAGLAKRAIKGLPIVAMKTPEDIVGAKKLISETKTEK